MALTRVSGGILKQPIDVGIITATSLNASGIVTAGTVQVGSATTIHTTGIDLGSGNVTSHNINSTGIITATSFVGPVTGNASSATVATNAQGLTGSPSITVTDITASGNVSIAGTLTYEDVTNIDAVGIITAQAGIDAASNLLLKTGGNERLRIDSSGRLLTGNISETVVGAGGMHIYQSSAGNNLVSLILENHGTTTDTSTELKFVPSDASPNDRFNSIRVTDVDGANKFDTLFFTCPGGTPLERFRITNAGDLQVGNITNLVASGAGKLNILADDTTNLGIATDGAINISCASGAGVGRVQSINWVPGFNVTLPTASIGHVYTDAGGYGKGDLFFATRGSTSNAAATERLRIDSSGKVKIANHGTNDLRTLSVLGPQTQIQFGTAEDVGGFLLSTNNGQFGLSGGGYYNGSNWVAKHTASAQIRTDGDGAIVFCTNTSLTSGNTFSPSEKMRLNSGGHLGIGNADPTQARLVAQTASGMSIAAIKDNTGASISLGGVTQPRVLMEASSSASEFKLYTAGGSSYGSAGWNQRLTMGSTGQLTVSNTVSSNDAAVNILKSSGDNSDKAILRIGYDAAACFEAYRIRNDANIYMGATQAGADINISTKPSGTSSSAVALTINDGGVTNPRRFATGSMTNSAGYQQHQLGYMGDYFPYMCNAVFYLAQTSTGNSGYSSHMFSWYDSGHWGHYGKFILFCQEVHYIGGFAQRYLSGTSVNTILSGGQGGSVSTTSTQTGSGTHSGQSVTRYDCTVSHSGTYRTMRWYLGMLHGNQLGVTGSGKSQSEANTYCNSNGSMLHLFGVADSYLTMAPNYRTW